MKGKFVLVLEDKMKVGANAAWEATHQFQAGPISSEKIARITVPQSKTKLTISYHFQHQGFSLLRIGRS